MTELQNQLLQTIDRLGPMSVADFMAQCLYHPEHGYYRQSPAIGKSADFITAPEISQLFGEMIGVALIQAFIDQGIDGPFNLVELGPGRGSLMADILRIAQIEPRFVEHAKLHLVETNHALRKVQAGTLEGFNPNWHENLDDIPDGPLFLVANEFFDCLPIRQFRKTDLGWQEQMIGAENGTLGFVLGPVEASLEATNAQGTFLELCPSALALGGDIGRRIEQHGGAALIVDYGSNGSFADTFQAVKDHQKVDPLAFAGEADLTAHVDFAALRTEIQNHAKICGPITQGLFLESLGITQRAQQLANGIGQDALDELVAAHRRLTHPDEMGTLFKAMAVCPTNAPEVIGFVQ